MLSLSSKHNFPEIAYKPLKMAVDKSTSVSLKFLFFKEDIIGLLYYKISIFFLNKLKLIHEFFSPFIK